MQNIVPGRVCVAVLGLCVAPIGRLALQGETDTIVGVLLLSDLALIVTGWSLSGTETLSVVGGLASEGERASFLLLLRLKNEKATSGALMLRDCRLCTGLLATIIENSRVCILNWTAQLVQLIVHHQTVIRFVRNHTVDVTREK